MANNVTIPAQGTGTTTPVVETYDTTGSSGPQRQSFTLASVGSPSSITALTGTPSSGVPIGLSTYSPTSVLTRPANSTPYTAGNLIASNTASGSVTVPSVVAAGAHGGGFHISSLILTTNASGMGGVSLQINLWNAAPTYSNGDGGAYSVNTGSANWLGSFTVPSMIQGGDGAWGAAVPDVGSSLDRNCASGTSSIYWDLTAKNAFIPGNAQTFTLSLTEVRD